MAGFFGTLKQAAQKAASTYGNTGSIGQAAGSFWIYTTDYFLPNKQKFQVDGGRYGSTYQAIHSLEQAQEFAIAVNCIMREVGASDWKIHTRGMNGIESKPLENPNEPVLRLLRHPNPLHAWQSWIETAVALLLPTGNLYILKDPLSLAGTPMALWILRSDRTRPVRDDRPLSPVQAYEHYAEDGKRYVFPPSRVIHIKLPNAYTDYIGFGMVQLLQQTLEMDFRSMESNIQMFRQGGRLSTVIEGMDEDPDKLKDIKNKIIEAHMGSENAHRVLLLTGNAKLNTNAAGSQPKEADYKITREDISRGVGGMMGVPPMLMGHLEQINRATATVQQQQFLRNAIWPMMRRLTPAFQEIVEGFNPNFEFSWPHADVIDVDTLAQILKSGLDGAALSPNDAREKFFQLPRDKNPRMDMHFILGTQASIEEGGGTPVQPGGGGDSFGDPAPASKLPRPPGLSEKALKGSGPSFPKGTPAQRRILRALKAERHKFESVLTPVFEKHIKIFAAKAADAFERRGGKAYDDSGTSSGLEAEVKNIYEAQLVIAADDAEAIFNVDMSDYDAGSAAIAQASTNLAQRVTWMDETNKAKLASVIEEGTQLGLSPTEIANGNADGSFIGIRQTFDGIAREHAQLIARTETARLQDEISNEAYKKMGVTTCDVIGCEDFVIMPGERYGCNSQNVPMSACPINFHPNHHGATVPHLEA